MLAYCFMLMPGDYRVSFSKHVHRNEINVLDEEGQVWQHSLHPGSLETPVSLVRVPPLLLQAPSWRTRLAREAIVAAVAGAAGDGHAGESKVGAQARAAEDVVVLAVRHGARDRVHGDARDGNAVGRGCRLGPPLR